MDKRTATLTLTEKLHKLDYVNIVTDPAVKSHLLSNAKSAVLDLEIGMLKISTINGVSLRKIDQSYNVMNINGIYPAANYFFVEHGTAHNNWADKLEPISVITPLAMITDVEERTLRNKFYKDVPHKILDAFKVLEISDFVELYKKYSLFKEGQENFFQNFKECWKYRNFRSGEKVEIEDIIQGAKSKNYYLVNAIDCDGSITGYKFQDIGLKNMIGNGRQNCPSDCIIPIKKLSFDNFEFFDFIFSLPYEEQNTVANKWILKNSGIMDFHEVLLKEYSEGKLFEDYFSVLDSEQQKKVVDEIKSLKNQNEFLNSWLFNQGFITELDYIKLYKEDAGKFIEYFKKSKDNDKKIIILDIFNCGFINQEVVTFLEETYEDILQKIAFE